MKGSVDKVLAQFYPVSLKISSVVGLFYSCWYRKRPHFVVLKASLWSMEKVGKISCINKQFCPLVRLGPKTGLKVI